MKKGWNTWTSSLPKEYLVDFLLEGGEDQIVYIDNVLPCYYKNRTKESLTRLTNVYKSFISDMYYVIYGSQCEIKYMSQLFSFQQFLAAIAKLKFSNSKRAEPKMKRQLVKNGNFVELIHTAAEFYLFQIMKDDGVEKIMKGSGQLGMIYESSMDDIIQVLDKERNTLNNIYQSSLSQRTKNIIDDRLRLWKKAKLLKNYSDMDDDRFLQKATPNVIGILLSLEEFYSKYHCSLLLCGSQANARSHTKSDVDVVCISENVIIPKDSAIELHSEIVSRYKHSRIREVSIKYFVNQIKVSIRFVNPSYIFDYFNNPTVICL